MKDMEWCTYSMITNDLKQFISTADVSVFLFKYKRENVYLLMFGNTFYEGLNIIYKYLGVINCNYTLIFHILNNYLNQIVSKILDSYPHYLIVADIGRLNSLLKTFFNFPFDPLDKGMWQKKFDWPDVISVGLTSLGKKILAPWPWNYSLRSIYESSGIKYCY